MRPFSGGEKSRLVLAMLVYQKPNLLLLDEPTNHLDLEMRQALALALQDFAGAVVLVSHDRHLLRLTCDRLLLVDDRAVTEFAYSLEDYPKWLAEHARGSIRSVASSTGASRAVDKKEKKRREAEWRQKLQPLRKKIAATETQLQQLQARRQALESRLSEADLYSEENKQQLKQLLLEKADVDRQHEAVEIDWMDASEQLEQVESAEKHL